jgi:galactose-1-phosphate uridylyltransferase
MDNDLNSTHENIFYSIMPDGTVKQINPFTGTEVWAVPGRGNRPLPNQIPATATRVVKKEVEDYCSFCPARVFETPPEKSRLIKRDGAYVKLDMVPPDQLSNTAAEFRRTPNLFEMVTIDYWRKNYNYKLTDAKRRWKESYLGNPAGLKHVLEIIDYKLRMSGKTKEQIEKIPVEEKLQLSDAFFGGGHEIIIARRHYRDNAEWDSQLCFSGDLTAEEHFWFAKFTIDAMMDIFENNRYVRYISVFQNWLRPAGASFDHLHKQLVAIDDWGASLERQIRMLREDPNVFNEYGANFAARHNLVFAENDHALAFAGFGHRFPTIEIHSKSNHTRPHQHTDEELRGFSDLVHACHAATGVEVSSNVEWYYTPIDAVYEMPWHVLIKWRINVPAGFEGGTSIFINPLTPIDLRDKLVPRLYKLRDEGKIRSIRIAEECRITPNPLKYYLK